MKVNFMNVGRLNTQMKIFHMEMKWKERKKNNDFKPARTIEIQMLEQIQEEQRTKDHEFETIKAKLYTGKSLTSQEMDYLSKKDPQMYQKAKEIENKRKQYEKEIKNCKTKEETERIKMSHISSVFSNIQSIMNNPLISKSKKLELVMYEKQYMKAIEEVTIKFMGSGEYTKLPTEAEKEELEQPETEREDLENMHVLNTPTTSALELENRELTKVESEYTPEVHKAEYARNKRKNQRLKYDNYNSFIPNSMEMEWKA